MFQLLFVGITFLHSVHTYSKLHWDQPRPWARWASSGPYSWVRTCLQPSGWTCRRAWVRSRGCNGNPVPLSECRETSASQICKKEVIVRDGTVMQRKVSTEYFKVKPWSKITRWISNLFTYTENVSSTHTFRINKVLSTNFMNLCKINMTA